MSGSAGRKTPLIRPPFSLAKANQDNFSLNIYLLGKPEDDTPFECFRLKNDEPFLLLPCSQNTWPRENLCTARQMFSCLNQVLGSSCAWYLTGSTRHGVVDPFNYPCVRLSADVTLRFKV